MTINSHNHGPNEGRGVDCGEPRLADGSPIGWCQILPIIRKAKAQAWEEGHSRGWTDAQEAHDVRQHMDRAEWPLRTPNPYTEES